MHVIQEPRYPQENQTRNSSKEHGLLPSLVFTSIKIQILQDIICI